MSEIASWLGTLLAEGEFQIGQIHVRPGIVLTHRDDTDAPNLTVSTSPDDALELAKYDDSGTYRPLKTAPNLRHGWRMELASVPALRQALDYFYPAAVGTWLAYRTHRLKPVPWRDTVGRQTGMYAVTKKITDDDSEELFATACRSGCLRRILWPLETARPHRLTVPNVVTDSPREVPILCNEACNLLVAAARTVVKKKGSVL